MNGSLRYKTVERGRAILDELYGTNAFSSMLKCHIIVPTATERMALDFYLGRMRDSYSYELANRDRVYRTTGRLSPSGDSFPVDVIIRYGAEDMPATISISEEMNQVIRENRY